MHAATGKLSLIALVLLLTATAVAAPSPQSDEGIVTLYAVDPEASSLSFTNGEFGYSIKGTQVFNHDSHLAFDVYDPGSFTVGIQGNQRGAIVDIGSREELKQRYGYAETVGTGQGYASLHREGGSVVILKTRKPPEFQPVAETKVLWDENKRSNSATVRPGHVYVARIWDDEGLETLVKILVLEFRPGESATFRWARI